LRGARPGGVAS